MLLLKVVIYVSNSLKFFFDAPFTINNARLGQNDFTLICSALLKVIEEAELVIVDSGRSQNDISLLLEGVTVKGQIRMEREAATL